MMRSLLVAAFALLLTSPVLAQTGVQTAAQPAAQQGQPFTLRTGTRLVVVDVSVLDKQGKPILGLTKDSFKLTEGGVPQTIRNFEAHTTQEVPAKVVEMPKLPPGTFTDYQPVPPEGTLNILLLDALNTPAADQSYVHTQLQEYIKHAAPGTRIAIFGLTNQLILLQGFSSDPQTLKDAINKKTIPRYSSLLDDPGGSGADPATAADLVQGTTDLTTATNQTAATAAANYQQFNAEIAATQLQLRLEYTLDAFNALGHYLSAFPGRKNLIWFSGSFPLNILPNPALGNPFALANLNEEEFRDTVNLLAKAQVAVFPVDARGVRTPTVYNAGSSGRRYGQNPQAFGADLSQFTSDQNNEHATMDTMAASTGGRAFYNTNALSTAVSQAVEVGSTYYTLAYAPSNTTEDGTFRKIEITVGTPAASRGLQLAYRHGYYADDAKAKTALPRPSAVTTQAEAAQSHSTGALERAAMSRGAPTPEDMLFTVRVLPANTAIETTAAPGNSLGKAVSAQGPFRRYAVDYVALPRKVTLTQGADGRRTGELEFLVYVFDVDGTLLNAEGKTVDLNLTPASYASFEHGVIEAHLEVSVPARGETFLRVAVRDVPSNRFGAVEIPTSSVSHLPPAVYAPSAVGATPPASEQKGAASGQKTPATSSPR